MFGRKRGVKRGRSSRRICKKSADGKHQPKVKIRQGLVNKQAVLVCKLCGKRMGRTG